MKWVNRPPCFGKLAVQNNFAGVTSVGKSVFEKLQELRKKNDDGCFARNSIFF